MSKSGKEKFDEMGKKLKSEKQESDEREAEAIEMAVKEFSDLNPNSELGRMYNQDANLGSENVGGAQSPLLKIHAQGRSRDNELKDGSKPNDGWFFYKPTQEQFETIRCHVLAISKGFRADGLDGKKNIFNQLLGGVIVEESREYRPFVMYMTGLKLQPMWDFGKAVSKYTRRKPQSIPMFALTVELSTDTVKHDYGESYVVKFKIVDDNGYPEIVTDPGEYQYLKDSVQYMQEMFESLISTKTTEDQFESDSVPHPADADDIDEIL